MTNTYTFLLSTSLAVALPLIAVRYLQANLFKFLRALCDAEGGAEFWIRSAYLLAVSGTLVLQLTFGKFDTQSEPVDVLRRTLLLALAGVFATVAVIASKVGNQVPRSRAAASASAATTRSPA